MTLDPEAGPRPFADGDQDLEAFFQSSPDLLCIAGTDGYFKRINPAFERVLGWPQEEFLKRPFLDWVHPNDREATVQELARLKRGLPTQAFDNRYRTAAGHYLWLRWNCHPEHRSGRLFATARDVTAERDQADRFRLQQAELNRAKLSLERLAHTDELTELSNRRAFDQQAQLALKRAQRHGRPVSLAIVDLDHFKSFNDRFGHCAGDHALKRAATLLKGAIRETDFVARYGGDEFVALFPETDRAGAVPIAMRLQDAVSSVSWPGQQPLTLSVGVETFLPDERNAKMPARHILDELLSAADQAMYLSKKHGRNRITHADES